VRLQDIDVVAQVKERRVRNRQRVTRTVSGNGSERTRTVAVNLAVQVNTEVLTQTRHVSLDRVNEGLRLRVDERDSLTRKKNTSVLVLKGQTPAAVALLPRSREGFHFVTSTDTGVTAGVDSEHHILTAQLV